MTSRLYDKADAVASGLASLELRNFAVRLGLTPGRVVPPHYELVVDAVACIDELSWEDDERASRLVVLIASILWEYAAPEMREGLRQRFVLCLSRLGLSPAISMVDASAKVGDGFGALSSFRAQVAALAMQLENSIVTCGQEFSLTRFQKDVIDAVDQNRLVGISAPTSAGKSFALYLAIARYLETSKQGRVVYIVPTVSLINQVALDLRRLFQRLGCDHLYVRDNTNVLGNEPGVMVLTQERALSLISEGRWIGVSMLVVDEVQNLERVGNDDELRAKMLLDAITDLSNHTRLERIVISGPRLDNVGAIGAKVFGGVAREVVAVEGPVAGLTYSIARRGGKAYITQHREILRDSREQIEIADGSIVQGQGKSLYTEAFHDFLAAMLQSIGESTQSIIFSPTADQSVKTTHGLRAKVGRRGDPRNILLSNYLADSVHEGYSLTSLVRDGLAYHNGKVPPHARFAVEEAFRDGSLSRLVCTTTLMQGVNLPASIVFIRNPRLYVRGGEGRSKAQLSAYEFSNLRGRAGRLMKDLVGRTVVLDEDSFLDEEEGQLDLFASATKSVQAGYGAVFAANREQVVSELLRPGVAVAGMAKFLATYIRQTALKLGGAAHFHLGALGIELSPADFGKTLDLVRSLDIDPAVCASNRYWDPFDLQLLQDSAESAGLVDLPSSVWERGLADTLSKWLDFHSAVVPYYFKRYLRAEASPKFIQALSKSAEVWGREVPLRKIIESRHFAASELGKIDSQVSLIYKHVVYGIPALLKPLADIRKKGGAVLAAIESGSHHPATRYLISEGLFRETAVGLRSRLMPEMGADRVGVEQEVSARVRAARSTFDPWIDRQIECMTRWGGE